MAAQRKVDIVLGGSVLTLLLYGILIMAGVSAPFALKNFGSPSAYLFHQLLYGIVPGLAVCGIFVLFPIERLRRASFPMFILTLFALLLVLFPPFGMTLGGASRWFALGPVSFQPSEFLKFAFILYWGALLARFTKASAKRTGKLQESPKRQRGISADTSQGNLFVFLLLSGILGAILVLQPDISTLGIIIAFAFIMYFVAKTPLWHSFAFAGIAAGGLAILVKLAPYRMQRLLVFLDPSTDPMGIGYQAKQALIAVGSGGLWGIGFSMNSEHVKFLPAAMSDTLFAATAQEIGFIGATFLILLFLVFLWRCFRIAKKVPDEFSRLIAMGVGSWIGLQAFINMGAMTGLLPLAGIPLPFLSYGGSHLIAELAGVGILLNISRNI